MTVWEYDIMVQKIIKKNIFKNMIGKQLAWINSVVTQTHLAGFPINDFTL